MASAEQIPSEKPLHVQVAEALGWSAWLSKHDYWHITEPDGTRHEDGFGMSRAKYDERTGRKLPLRQWWEEYDPPRYDTDWTATGPLIERLGITVLRSSSGWCALRDANWLMLGLLEPPEETPLLAVCRLILALKADGKL